MDKESLKKEIEIEIENLERLNKEMEEIIEKSTGKPDFIHTRAAGSVLHDFYCGVEKIFKRISIHIDGELPKGEDYHTELLLQMAKPVKGIRGSVIGQELLGKLKEYLRFRHLFRHIYGFELKWERFKNLSFALDIIFKEIKDSLHNFLKNLDSGFWSYTIT